MEKHTRCFGCDLGTTNSALSTYIGNDASEIITLETGKTTIPSCVMLNNDGSLTVGEIAYEYRYLPSVAYSVKKYMGTDKIITLKAENGTTRDFKPEEIGAEVIKELVKRAAYMYPNIKNICITVPAAFNNSQREATRRAGELAGLNVVSIINEPTSAALCYNVVKSEDILIYDLGGGTFDTTILRATVPENVKMSGLNFTNLGIDLSGEESEANNKPVYNVLTSKGDSMLGGDDIDEELLKMGIRDFNSSLKSKGLQGTFETYIKDDYRIYLKLRIEQMKKQIHNKPGSSLPITKIDHNFLVEENIKKLETAFKGSNYFYFNYDMLVKATKIIFNKTRTLVNRALASGNVNRNNINKIILVGGSTESEILRSLLRETYKECEINIGFKPYDIVAQGASIQAAIDCGISTLNLTDVSPYTIGVGIIEENEDTGRRINKVSQIIKKDTKLPVIKRNQFKVDNKSNALEIKIYQGEGILTSDCTLIGTLRLDREYESETATLVTKINTDGIVEFQAESGNVTNKIELMNIFGVDKKENQRTNKFIRIARRWRDSFNLANIEISGELKEAFDKFEETGDTEAKGIIISKLEEIPETDLRKTSNFGK